MAEGMRMVVIFSDDNSSRVCVVTKDHGDGGDLLLNVLRCQLTY